MNSENTVSQPPSASISKPEKMALKNLNSNPDNVISSADKTNNGHSGLV